MGACSKDQHIDKMQLYEGHITKQVGLSKTEKDNFQNCNELSLIMTGSVG